MNKFKDIIEGVIAELVETPLDKKFLAKAKIGWGKSDFQNKNGRIYSDLIAAPAILKFNKEAEKNVGILGNLDHPAVGASGTLLSNASHLVSRVWKDENKNWLADVKIMNTSKGRDLLAVLKAGAKVGASLRGIGEINKKGEVLPGLEFHAIDFVSQPSFGASATIDQSNVFESFQAEEGDEFTNEDLKEFTKAMNGLSDKTVEMIQQKLEKSEGIAMSEERIKGLILWIKCSKDNPNIKPFAEWFVEQEEKFGIGNSNFQEEINDGLRRKANLKAEKRMAESPQNANTMFASRKRIEARKEEIDEALSGKTMSDRTISRLFAEACLAGYKGSRADWINEFGF